LSLARRFGVTLFTPNHERRNLKREGGPTGVEPGQLGTTGGKPILPQGKPLRDGAFAD
jgi:hypothetical protein